MVERTFESYGDDRGLAVLRSGRSRAGGSLARDEAASHREEADTHEEDDGPDDRGEAQELDSAVARFRLDLRRLELQKRVLELLVLGGELLGCASACWATPR
jgi:hypothetical protein